MVDLIRPCPYQDGCIEVLSSYTPGSACTCTIVKGDLSCVALALSRLVSKLMGYTVCTRSSAGSCRHQVTR